MEISVECRLFQNAPEPSGGADWRRDAQRGSSEGLETRGEAAAWRGRFWFWFQNFIAYRDSPRLSGGEPGGTNETPRRLTKRSAAPTLVRGPFACFLPSAT